MKFKKYIHEHAGHARPGGEHGINGWLYKGGQFLPTTHAEPGRWKVGKKWVTTGKELIEPGKWEIQPTPLSRSIFALIGGNAGWVETEHNKFKITDREIYTSGSPMERITGNLKITPGVKGILGKEEFTLQELIDQYNKGARWIQIEPPEHLNVIRDIPEADWKEEIRIIAKKHNVDPQDAESLWTGMSQSWGSKARISEGERRRLAEIGLLKQETDSIGHSWTTTQKGKELYFEMLGRRTYLEKLPEVK